MRAYTFVLIHGNWHDGMAWNAVVRRLEGHGHHAYAPTVAGHGRCADRHVTHDDCARSIVDYITGHNLTDIVLVGHSGGGTWIAKVAEYLPERIRRLVFCNAFVLYDGESQADNIPEPIRQVLAGLAAESANNTMTLPFDLWREAMMNDADLELARAAYQTLTPEPYRMFTEPVALKTFHSLPIPRSFLLFTEDAALMPGEWGWHPRITSRLGNYRFLSMPAGHEAMFSAPNLLADKLIEAGRD